MSYYPGKRGIPEIKKLRADRGMGLAEAKKYASLLNIQDDLMSIRPVLEASSAPALATLIDIIDYLVGEQLP